MVAKTQCKPFKVKGFTEANCTEFKQIVVLNVTFRESVGREVERAIAFLVGDKAVLPMILGCPTLDEMGAHWTREVIVLEAP